MADTTGQSNLLKMLLALLAKQGTSTQQPAAPTQPAQQSVQQPDGTSPVTSLLKMLSPLVSNTANTVLQGNTPDLSTVTSSIPGYNIASDVVGGNVTGAGTDLLGSLFGSAGGLAQSLGGGNPALDRMIGTAGGLAGNLLTNTGVFSPASQAIDSSIGNMGLSSANWVNSFMDPGQNIGGAGGILQSIIGNIPLIGPVISGFIGGIFGDDYKPVSDEQNAKMGNIEKGGVDRLNDFKTQLTKSLGHAPTDWEVFTAASKAGLVPNQGLALADQSGFNQYYQGTGKDPIVAHDVESFGINAPTYTQGGKAVNDPSQSLTALYTPQEWAFMGSLKDAAGFGPTPSPAGEGQPSQPFQASTYAYADPYTIAGAPTDLLKSIVGGQSTNDIGLNSYGFDPRIPAPNLPGGYTGLSNVQTQYNPGDAIQNYTPYLTPETTGPYVGQTMGAPTPGLMDQQLTPTQITNIMKGDWGTTLGTQYGADTQSALDKILNVNQDPWAGGIPTTGLASLSTALNIGG
jgi:hypothetical protein